MGYPSLTLPTLLFSAAHTVVIATGQVPDLCMAPSHSPPLHQPPPVPDFPPAVVSSFPLGVRTEEFSPTPSRSSCRNKRDLSGNDGFNMVLALPFPGVVCVGNLGLSPATPPHPHISFYHGFRWKEP